MRRTLSIVACPAYAPSDPTPRSERGCEHCGHRVHELSALTEVELGRLLDGPEARVCVHAKVRRDGTPVLTGSRRALAMGLAAGLAAVAACAPHVTELELPGSLCEDADGFEIDCESELERWLESLPEQLPAPDDSVSPEGERSQAEPAPRDDDESEYLGMIYVVEDARETSPAAVKAERERLLEIERRARAHARGQG
ncbi:MAG: hypothetical protein AB1Z98_39285 [Nannocystaceae bacterium]